MAEPGSSSSRPPDSGRSFGQRLGLYLGGVAVGLMFLGWVQMRKGMSVRKHQAAARQVEQGEQQTGPSAESKTKTKPKTPAQTPDG